MSPRNRVCLFAIVLFATSLWASERLDLNGEWQFRIDPQKQGEQQNWAAKIPADTETVRVPHTWNLGKYDDYEGTAWYFRTFTLSREAYLGRVELHFGATFYKSRVWVNGKEAGGHEGGYTAYFFDITKLLVPGVNLVAVELNNQPGFATIPGWAMKLRGGDNVWYDWWHYGGIVRDAWLTVSEGPVVRHQRIRTRISGNAADVTDTVYVENSANSHVQHMKVVANVFSLQDGAQVATATENLMLAPGAQREVNLKFHIAPVELWSLDNPNLYRVQVELDYLDGRVLDMLSDNFGARTVEIRDRHLLINGERLRLSGLTRHEESPWEGLAETRGTILYDWDDLKNLQTTLTRPVHYPQNPLILDYADRHGILFIPEIPLWQFSEQQLSDPRVVKLAQQQMREMIEQAGNHPSIFAWSVCNESATSTPGGRRYVQTMKQFIRELDPDRYVSFADDSIAYADPAQNASQDADFVMMNQYFGSWHGPASLLPQVLDKVGRSYPDKMFIISEFGLAGVHAPNAKVADERRIKIIRDQMAEFAKRDWIAGALLWCYQDYKSHRNLWPGQTEGYVDHGVVDEWRQRRPSYYVWQKENEPARIALEWTYKGYNFSEPVGFHATISARPETEIPSYTLHGYKAHWELRDDEGNLVAHGDRVLQQANGTDAIGASFNMPKTKSLSLKITVSRPIGFMAAEESLNWWRVNPGGQNVEQMNLGGEKLPPK